MKALGVIIIFVLIPFQLLATFGRNDKQVTFYTGFSYKSDNNFYRLYDISYEHYRKSCTYAHLRGCGVRYDNYGNGNYAVSAKFFSTFKKFAGVFCLPYLAVSPVVFRSESQTGLNLKPEFGVRFNTSCYTRRIKSVSLSINVAYGYDVPLINPTDYKVGRHELSAKIGVSINLSQFYYYRKSR